MTFLESPLKKVKSWFSSEELSSLGMQTSIQGQSSSEDSSPLGLSLTKETVLKVIQQAHIFMDREDDLLDNGSVNINEIPWIILTKDELDKLKDMLEILQAAKRTQLLENSHQTTIQLYLKSLNKRLEQARQILEKNSTLDRCTSLIMESEVQQTLPLSEFHILSKLSSDELVKLYEERIPLMMKAYKKELESPLDVSIDFLSRLEKKKPNPINDIHYQYRQQCEEAIANGNQIPLLFSTDIKTIQAIFSAKKLWLENRAIIESLKQGNQTAVTNVDISQLKSLLGDIYDENTKNPTLRKECLKQLDSTFEKRNLYDVLKDLSYLIQKNETNEQDWILT